MVRNIPDITEFSIKGSGSVSKEDLKNGAEIWIGRDEGFTSGADPSSPEGWKEGEDSWIGLVRRISPEFATVGFEGLGLLDFLNLSGTSRLTNQIKH